jgi:hypothetical protein
MAKTKVKRPSSLAAARKPTLAIGDAVRANGKAPADYRGRTGIVTEMGPGDAEYRVEFEDGERPTTGYLTSAWLDRA